jgi:AcrR family transcriptional regulator
VVEPRTRPPTGRGRRVGKPDTKQRILHVALQQFAELGFPGATIRSVAAAAEVDPSLITHFFVNKDSLFAASVDGLLDELRPQMVSVLSSDLPHLGTRLAGTYLGFWEDPAVAPRLSAVYRSAS